MRFKSQLASALATGILAMCVPTAVLGHPSPSAPTVRQEGQGTYENMIAALDNLGAELDRLNSTTNMSLTSVRIFDATYLASGQDPAALEQAVATHGEQIQTVRSAIANHEVVRTALQMVNVPIESVVAIDALDAGDVAIYYQP